MMADDMLALAEHDEHMAEWCENHNEHGSELVGYALHLMGQKHRESARYWREKAKPMDELQWLGQEYDNE